MQDKDKIKFTGNTTRPGNPLWNEYTDEFGNSTLTVHSPRKIWEACKNGCFYIASDNQGNVQCRKCGNGKKIVWGIHKLVNGKIVPMQKK